jgi:hypothetical protein
MSEEKIPQDVIALLQEHVHSYEQLEILVLLRGWSGEELVDQAVAQALGIPVESAAGALRQLAETGVLESITQSDLQWRYRGPRDDLRPAIDGLAKAYKESRLEVMRLMTVNAIRRMRTGAMRAFADAFVVGKKRNDG